MAEDVNPNLIRQTQEALSKHIKKPPLHEKFLKKPPFRFLQDIIKSVIRETKFLNGKFSEQDFENAKDRDTKIKFLDSVIAEVEAATGKKVSARPAKIVAGLDVNKTLELLILLGQAVDKTGDAKSKKSVSDKAQSEKKPLKTVEAEKESQKKDEEKKVAKKTDPETENRDSNRKVLDKNQVTKDRRTVTKSNQRVDGKDLKQSTSNRKVASKPKEDEKKPSPARKKPAEKSNLQMKDEPPHVDSKKIENESNNASRVEEAKTKDQNEDSNVEHPSATQTAAEEREKSDAKSQEDRKDKNAATTETQNKNQEIEQTKRQASDTRKPTDNVKEPKRHVESAKETRKQEKAGGMLQKSDESTTREASGKGPERRVSTTSERNDSARVMSSIGRLDMNQRSDSLVKETTRPLKLDVNRRVFTPDKAARQQEEKPVNIFTESQDDKDDADDMYILETQYVAPTNGQATESKGEFTEQGQLVSQIIDTKKQLESKETEMKTKIQWEESATWRRNTGEKEVGGVKTLIQQLTKNAGPLGQLLAGLQEDVDEMMQELAQWRQINAQLAVDMKKEKELTNELIKPLVKHLEELEQVEYPQEIERVKAARMAVYANDKKIEELLESRTK